MQRLTATTFALLLGLILAAPAAAFTPGDAGFEREPNGVEGQRNRDRDDGPRETETVDRTLTMPAGGTLRLKTFSGRVKITGGSGDQLVVHAIRRA